MSQLAEILAQLTALPPDKLAEIDREATAAPQVKRMKWLPNPGPQTDAFFSQADILLFGGQAGPGKSDLLLGLALTSHYRSLILRKQYTDLGALTDRALEINGGRDGFNGSPPPKLRTSDGRMLDFGAAARVGDEQHWQGQPHDFLGVDEAVHFAESQLRFLMTWVRSTRPGQRKRVVFASNPPVGAQGTWVIRFFAPWLDPTYPNPAQPGELRWFITDDNGRDLEVNGPEKVIIDGREYEPLSRTFIPGQGLAPQLEGTGYAAQLDALIPELRAALRDGNFMAARKDDPWQVIPTSWVLAAINRWKAQPPAGIPQCAIGVDVAQGGAAETVLAVRHDGWFDRLKHFPGHMTPDGPSVAGLILQHRRDNSEITIDCGGGYGGSAYDHLKKNDLTVRAYKGSEATTMRTKDGLLGFVNTRMAAYWKLREALDPGQLGGSVVALPDDPMMVADLTALTFEVGPRGIGPPKGWTKEDLEADLGRSMDHGDAIILSWWNGPRFLTHGAIWHTDPEQGIRRREGFGANYGPRRSAGMRRH